MSPGRTLGVALAMSMAVSAARAQEPQDVISRLFAATADGAHLSYSWGEHWVRLRGDMRGFEGELTEFVCLGPAVFAGGSKGLFVSQDYGESYFAEQNFPGADVTALLTARLFALEPTLFAGTSEGLYRSVDGGSRWTRMGEALLESAVRDLAWPGPQLFVATDDGLYLSEDGGESWRRIDNGLPRVALHSIALSQFFVVDPKIFIGSASGLFASEDGGEHFAPAGLDSIGQEAIHDLYWWGGLLLVGADHGLFLSSDGGKSFEPVADLNGRSVYSIAIPAPEGVVRSDVLVGTDRGVYKSSDGVVRFRLVAEGMGAPVVTGLATFPMPVQDRERRR